jgi:transportin-1
MNIQISKDQDVDAYKDRFYEDYTVEFVDEELEEGGDADYQTLRRASAYAIETISRNVGQSKVFEVLNENISQMMKSDDEQDQEAAIMVLGSISDPDYGLDHLESHLDSVVPFLGEKLLSTHFVTRSSTCWTISKFSTWISAQPEQEFEKYINTLISTMQDTE